MPYEEYWYADTNRIWAYVKADELRQQRKDSEFWLQGAYVLSALQSALSVSEFFRPKNQRPLKYPEKPFGTKKDENAEARKERERLAAYAALDALIQRHNKG